MVPSNQAICSIHAAESNTFFSPTTQLALSAQDPELTSLVVWAEIRTIVTLIAQFDGMMQLTLQELTVVMVCADNEGPGNKQLAHLIFQTCDTMHTIYDRRHKKNTGWFNHVYSTTLTKFTPTADTLYNTSFRKAIKK